MTTAFIAGIGPIELVLVFLIVVVVMGGRRLPQLGRQLGEGLREAKDALSSRTDRQFADDDGRASARVGLAPGAEEATPADGEIVPERR